MREVKLHEERVKSFVKTLYNLRYETPVSLKALYYHVAGEPITYEQAIKGTYKPIKPGQKWAKVWETAWFKFTGTIPERYAGKEVGALLDTDSEACVWKDGIPYQGLTNNHNDSWHWGFAPKRLVLVTKKARGGESVSFLVEGAANRLWGVEGVKEFSFSKADLVVINRAVWDLYNDVLFLDKLMTALPENSVRRKRLLRGLMEIVNSWNCGVGMAAGRKICQELLSVKASSSATTAITLGHAHMDLAWLWPTRETKRKGARTFATALRMMEEYPGYKFCSTQPQLYEWIKEQYPGLYKQIQAAVRKGTLECVGATWVEFDANISGGESMIRQCMAGKAFFKKEFGVDVRNCLLPDSFGFNGQLPQILKKSGMDYFVTQKMCWNDTNQIPLHTFYWKALDGSAVLTHFLPTNTYSANCVPQEVIGGENAYHQVDVSNEWLNLIGMGDGGGGPSRKHIEMAMRQKDVDGTPHVVFDTIANLFKRLEKIPAKNLPDWQGEFYNEFHRGVYTTQAKTKKLNRSLEHHLHDVEFLSTVGSKPYPASQLRDIWKSLMLHQFHDILPGSSIARVYAETEKNLGANIADCLQLRLSAITSIVGGQDAVKAPKAFAIVNTQPWPRTELITLPDTVGSATAAVDAQGNRLVIANGQVRVSVPSMGYSIITLEKSLKALAGAHSLTASKNLLENTMVRIRFNADGTFSSLYDKDTKRELIAGRGNRLMLWEDPPNSLNAWDILHVYEETTPVAATLVKTMVKTVTPLLAAIQQTYTVSKSTITLTISITADSPQVTVAAKIDWKEAHRMLRMRTETTIQATEAAYEMPFSVVKRAIHQNTSWDQARFEVCAHTFADLAAPDYGLALLNNCKYGHRINGATMELTMLRSPKQPDDTADIGIQEFTYAFFPHAGSWVEGGVMPQAHAFNFPLHVQPLASVPKQLQRSFFGIKESGATVKIETVKQAENQEGIIIRLYEICGSSPSVTLYSDRPFKIAYEANMLEEIGKKLPGSGTLLKLSFTPFEIKTIVIK